MAPVNRRCLSITGQSLNLTPQRQYNETFMKMVLCILLALAVCTCALAVHNSRTDAHPPRKTVVPDIQDVSDDPGLAPTFIDNPVKIPDVPLLSDGSSVLDLPGQPVKDDEGKWWTIREPRVGLVRMLPCELLDETLRIMREQPEEKLLLSGEVYLYKNSYYFLLRKTAFAVQMAPVPAVMPVAPAPAPAAAPASVSRPASQPTSKAAYSEQIARSMLNVDPVRPVLPFRNTEIPKSAFKSLTPARQPLKAGPERIVANRIVRFHGPDAEGWYEVAFEADNTLQDPPLRLMPCAMLQRLQELNDRKEPVAREFYVSGEIIPSGDHAYLLPRDVRVKHELNEF